MNNNNNLKRLPMDEYEIRLNADQSIDIILSEELSELLKITKTMKFNIENSKIKDSDVIVLKSTQSDNIKLLYN